MNLFKTEQEIRKEFGENISFLDRKIEHFDVEVVAHFGNIVSPVIFCEDIQLIPLYNITHNVGYIIRKIVELFDASREDGIKLRDFDGTPIRIVIDNHNPYGGKAIAFGPIDRDRFVITKELITHDYK